MEHNKKFESYNPKKICNSNSEQIISPDALTVDSNTTTSTINPISNYFYANYENSKNEILSFQQKKNAKKISIKKDGISSLNVYSKGKIQALISTTTNNIKENNNTNTIDNNMIINNDIKKNKDFNRAMSQLKISQKNKIENKKNNYINNNNSMRPKNLIFNKRKINIKSNKNLNNFRNIINKKIGF